MNRKKDIVKMLLSISGSRAPYEVFCDWTKIMAIGIQNASSFWHDELWKQREEDYLKTIRPYGEDGQKFAEMMAMLAETMEDDVTDLLGEIYMESGCGNKNTGQFFTPYHVSLMTAKTGLQEKLNQVKDNERITMYEPSCGGGGMIIAAAQIMKENGIDYQRKLRVTAQDLDWKSVYMCYVQLSLLGIDAVVVQGDTLAEPYRGSGYPAERAFKTPRRMGALL